VTSSNLDIHLPVSRSLARLKAKAVMGQCGLTADDREDIEAQLLLAFCSRLRLFNSERSSLATFTCRVMDKEVASILRYRLAQRRLQLGRPELVESGAPDHAYGAAPSTPERLEFWLDVSKVIKALPAPLRETVVALCCGSPSEASEALGTARSVVYERIAQIRQAFLTAGIGPAYFAAGSGHLEI
jgi:DNA-directed RNA polymerase specialized sigma24 family protein